MNIIARKPVAGKVDSLTEWIVIDRGFGHTHQFVSATATATEDSIRFSEWFWGHYFETREQAMAHFNSREGL